ncbi:MAG: GGDEF domain-containing protein [Treponema sp.]|nr:GGDEF domain-containing protein [Treponema sp.]
MRFRFIIFFILSFISIVKGFSSEKRTIKLPFFENDALYVRESEENGNSYVSDFIENLNRYIDFDIEYIPIERQNLVEALEKGKIDLIPFLGKDVISSKKLIYSDTPSAIGSTVFASNRIPDMTNLKVGILNHAPRSLKQKIFNYVQDQGISATYFYYDTADELISDIYQKKVDVFTTIDFSIPQDFFVVATIENTFFYLAALEENKAFFENFNNSLSTLFLLNPSFLSTLRLRYILSSRYTINQLSPREENYVKNNNKLRFAVVMNDAPYSYIEKGKYKGIIIDLINEIGKASGFSVNYVPAYSYLEAMNLVRWGSADIIYSINEMLIQSDLLSIKPTSPFLSQKVVIVTNKAFDEEKGGAFVEIRGMQYSKEFLDDYCNVKKTIYVDNIDDCLSLIGKNEDFFTLIPHKSAEYYQQTHMFTNLNITNKGYSVAVSLGISRRMESELAAVLDKAIYTLTTSMFETFMERNMDTNQSLVSFIKKHILLFSLVAAAFVFLLALAIFLFILIETKRRKDRQIKQAMNLANRDSMTGLFNHIAFEKKVSGILTHQNDGETGVFVMIDIDDFKNVNDSLGHGKGDYVIVSVANILLSTFKGGDLKGRMGGDEFAVFMKNVSNLEDVKHKMRILQIAIKDYFEKSGLGMNVTCSIGISFCKGPQKEHTFTRLYKAADDGLYKVKKSGKNAFYIVEMMA